MAMAAEKISTKLFIQHPTAPDCKIVGILEQLSPPPGQSIGHGRKIALVRATSTAFLSFSLKKRKSLPECVSIFRFFTELWGQHISSSSRQLEPECQWVYFQAQRLFVSKTTCHSIAFRLIPIRFSVSFTSELTFFFSGSFQS